MFINKFIYYNCNNKSQKIENETFHVISSCGDKTTSTDFFVVVYF